MQQPAQLSELQGAWSSQLLTAAIGDLVDMTKMLQLAKCRGQ